MILIYLIFFSFLYMYAKKRCKGSLYKPLILLYIIGSACSIYVYYFIEPKEISILSISFHLLILTLFFKPIITYSREKKEMGRPDPFKFKIVGYFFIILGIISFLFFLKPSITALSGDVLSLRTDMVKEGMVLFDVGIVNTIAGTIANFYPLMLLFFFYSISFLDNSKWFNGLLLFASMSYIVHVFAYIGRDGAVFWIFSCIYSYVLFEDYIKEKEKRFMKKVFVVLSVFLIAGFVLISIGRFGLRSSHSSFLDPVTESFVNYQGEVLNNFGQYFLNVEPDYNIRHISSLFSGENEKILDKNRCFYDKYGFNSNIFSGFVTPFYSTFGSVILIILSIMYSSFMSNTFRKKTISFSNLILLTLIYQIPFHCYYYFRLSMNVGTFYILSTISLCLFFKKRS